MENELQELLALINHNLATAHVLTDNLEALAARVEQTINPEINQAASSDLPGELALMDQVQYGKGFHHDEGGFRWVASKGEMLIPTNLKQPSIVCFTLTCGSANCYAHFPFDVSIYLNESEVSKLSFDTSEQSHQVQINTTEIKNDLHIRIVSAQFFVPSRLGGNSKDNRHLSIKLSDVLVSYPVETQAPSPDPVSEPELQPANTGNNEIKAAENNSYGEYWDDYVRNNSWYAEREPSNVGRTDLVYPGDEWGNPELWTEFANRFLLPFLPDDLSGIAVEIGQGSGKYTLEVIDKVKKIICLDVSQEFINVAQKRLSQYSEIGKVKFNLLKLYDCNEMVEIIKSEENIPNIDLIFSIDSMLHVELHTLMAYFIAAAKCLKMGGYMTMGVASCVNDLGFSRLMDEVPWYYGRKKRISHQFYFLSKDIVYYLTDKLGFEIVLFDEGRDIYFVAKKVRDVPIDLKSIF